MFSRFDAKGTTLMTYVMNFIFGENRKDLHHEKSYLDFGCKPVRIGRLGTNSDRQPDCECHWSDTSN